ncbi:hypothetical protein PINS_up007640 [Pythium insidiosum]|nr:hypothetical protein PINS_up007640 [Pythium insidiosum]
MKSDKHSGIKMHRQKLRIPVVSADGDAASTRHLLALLATHDDLHQQQQQQQSMGRFSDVLVYLHGFPDLSVHPTQLDFASRLPFKLAEAWLADASRRVALLTFNFGGVLGSDATLRFADKLLSLEVEDAVAACRFARDSLLDAQGGRVHVVGLSTGAIIASLLRDRGVADTISVIAGLADLPKGIHYDFTDGQIAQMQRLGYCWKEFYLPDESPPLSTLATPVSLNGERAATPQELETADQRKIFLRLNRAYFDECKQRASLDIRRAVSRTGGGDDHGDGGGRRGRHCS